MIELRKLWTVIAGILIRSSRGCCAGRSLSINVNSESPTAYIPYETHDDQGEFGQRSRTRWRVLGHPWHTAHNYELLKLPVSWFYLPGDWHRHFRPLPGGVEWLDWDFDANDFDLIITHISHEGHSYFDRLVALKDKLPIIAIMHGVPDGPTMVSQFQDLVQDVHVVCNSYEQERMWNFAYSTTIIHGFDAAEWPATDYSARRAVTSLPGIDEDYPHFGRNYGIHLLKQVRERVPVTWIGRDIRFKNWTDYRNYLAQSCVYFNPTLASPMPRARGEAMMMGLVPVTTNNMGEWRFIEQGVNGFLVDNAEDASRIIAWLLDHPLECKLIGSRARFTALRRFDWQRWAEDWLRCIEEVTRRWRASHAK